MKPEPRYFLFGFIALMFLTQVSGQQVVSSEGGDYLKDSYIVEFQEPAAVEADTASVEDYRSRLESSHEDFRRKLEKRSVQAGFEDSYSLSFNGVALSGVSDEELQKIRQMPMVQRVQRNYVYSVELDDSVPQVDAPEVWGRQIDGVNNTGENVSIAIVDTGVDYGHPDLGNCTVQEFNNSNCGKVVEGHDFVNEDWNPMDNQGHGTHVAATAAGNGSLDGVAPSADILAYKVLDSDGLGSTSDIVAGIEEAAEKDADVISISIGGPGNPDSTMSTAVNNAVDSGSVVTVSAGNDGDFYTVSAPGTAEKAITVGAVDKSDNLADFSSKGPVTWTSSDGEDIISKPDLMAPGVNICAARWNDSYSAYTCQDNNHVSLQGTSMAAPHVAGAAALMLQDDPSMTPGQVKSALMGSTVKLGLIPFEQGTGRIDVSRAIDKDIVTYPQTVDFGNLTGEEKSSVNITLENIGSDTENVQLNRMDLKEFQGDGSRDRLNLNATGMELIPGERRTVKVTLDADSMGGIYHSYLNISTNTTGYSHRIPVSMARYLPAEPVIEYAKPDVDYTSNSSLNVSLRIKDYDENTTAVARWNNTEKYLWQQSMQREGEGKINLSEGLNNLTFEVYNSANTSASTNVSRDIVLDTNPPKIQNVTVNASIVDTPAKVRINVSATDDTALSLGSIHLNTTGEFQDMAPDLDTSSFSCSEMWGIDCSVLPDVEGDNTIDSCPTGSGSDEHVNRLEVDPGEVYVGQKVNVTARFDVWGPQDGIYLYHFDGDNWTQIFSGSSSQELYNISREVEIEKPGNHTFRAIIDYSPEDDSCASDGSFFDNDDVNVTAKSPGIGLDGTSDNGSYVFRIEEGAEYAEWRLNLSDMAGNQDTATGEIELNRPPEVLKYTVENSTGNETEVFDQGESANFSLRVEDVNGNVEDAVLEWRGPERTTVYSLEPEMVSNTTYYLNGSVGVPEEPGQLNMTFHVFDAFDDQAFASRNVTIKDYVPPDLNASAHKEVLFWRNNTVELEVNDSSGLEKAVLSTNRSGSWNNLSDRSVGFNGTEAVEKFNLSGEKGDVYWRVWVSDRFGNWNSSRVKRFEFVDFNVSFPERAELEEGIGVKMERPFWYTVNRSDLNWSYTGRAEKVKNGSGIYGIANFTVHNTGNYTVEVFANDSQGKVNTTQADITANVSDPASEIFFLDGLDNYPRANTTHELDYIFNAKKFVAADITVSNSTWNRSLNYTAKIDETEDLVTGEPYNATYCDPPGCFYLWPELSFNFSVQETGSYWLNATLNRSADTLKESERITFYRLQNMSYDLDVSNVEQGTLVIEGESGTIQQRPANSTNETGNFSNVPDLPDVGRNYSLIFVNYASYSDLHGSFIRYSQTDVNDSITLSFDRRSETVETGDKRLYRILVPEAGFDYRSATAVFDHEFDRIGPDDRWDLTVYQCPQYDGSCDEWHESELKVNQTGNGAFRLEAMVNDTDAVALGEPYTPPSEEDTSDDSSGSSGGSSGGFSGGGFSPPPEPEGIKEISLQPGEPVSVSFEGEIVEKIELTSETGVDSATVDLEPVEELEVEPPADAEETHDALNITFSGDSDIDANITFRLDRDNVSDPSRVSMYRYSEGWERLPTSLEEENSTGYYFASSTPGFSMFMIATREASCTPVKARKINGSACRTFDSCEPPEGWEKVTSCTNATAADQVREEDESSGDSAQGGLGAMPIAAGVSIILLIAAGAVLAWRRRERRQLEEEFAEVTEAVRKALQSDQDLPERRIAGLIDEADTAMEHGDYSRMEDVMEELVEVIREN